MLSGKESVLSLSLVVSCLSVSVCLSVPLCLSVSSLFFPSLFLPLSLPLFSVSASLCMCFSLSFCLSPSFHTERHLNVSPFLALTSCYHTACSTALRPHGECDSLIFAAIWQNIHRGVLLCVSLCKCILNCPRQATREWRPEGLVPVENVGGRWAAVQKHSGSISCKLGSELPRRVLPNSGLFCETLICRIRAALPAALWTTLL